MKNSYLLGVFVLLMNCSSKGNISNQVTETDAPSSKIIVNQNPQKLDTATFAGGCFWCVEASFEQIEGVVEAVSGYAGGSKQTADYRMVSSGQTAHAESVQVYYDPNQIDYETLLEIFFTAHDPTQLNRQGPDVGPQYRTAVFYHSEEQKVLTEAKIKELQPTYSKTIVTEINAYEVFYPAEDYHQDYERKHPYDWYIMNVSKPKIDRVKAKFQDRLKEGYQLD